MSALQPNTTLCNGKYKILKTLGQGGFGITYLAEMIIKEKLGNIKVNVAIKEFFLKDANDRNIYDNIVMGSRSELFKNYKEKFRKEALNLSKLSECNDIVNVYDVFDENNTVYFSMEYIEGQNLDDYIKQSGKLTESEATEYIKSIATALKHLHDNKMLHLDLKPKNIMRRNDGKLYLIDFGLSKQYDENDSPRSTTVGLGTPGYAPIEQANYKGSFAPTLDIYALGATFYKLLVGKTAPDAASIFEEGFTSLMTEMENANISKEVIAVVDKAMQIKKKDRYQNVDEFLEALPEVDNEITIIKSKDVLPNNYEPIEIVLSRENIVDITQIDSNFICNTYVGRSVNKNGSLFRIKELRRDIEIVDDSCSHTNVYEIVKNQFVKRAKYVKDISRRIHETFSYLCVEYVFDVLDLNESVYVIAEDKGCFQTLRKVLNGNKCNEIFFMKIASEIAQIVLCFESIGCSAAMCLKPDNICFTNKGVVFFSWGIDDNDNFDYGDTIIPREGISWGKGKNDVYNLAAIFYYMLTSEDTLYYDTQLNSSIQDIDNLKIPGYISKNITTAISMALSENENVRPKSVFDFCNMMGIERQPWTYPNSIKHTSWVSTELFDNENNNTPTL